MDEIEIKDELKPNDVPEPTAAEEDKAIRRRDYIERKEETRKAAHHIRLIAMWIFGGVLILGFSTMLGIWFFHMLSPPHLRWLDPTELVEIKSILLGIIIGGAGSIITKTFFESQ